MNKSYEYLLLDCAGMGHNEIAVRLDESGEIGFRVIEVIKDSDNNFSFLMEKVTATL